MTKHDAVLVALHALSGNTKFVHEEEIAFKAHEICPVFSWALSKFKDQINLSSVSRLLRGCRAEGYVKSISSRWILTPEGIEYLKSANADIKTKPPSTEWEKTIFKSKLYKKWLKRKKIEISDQYALFNMLGVTPDSSYSVIRSEFDILKSSVASSGDKATMKFIKDCEEIIGEIEQCVQ